MIHHFFLGLIQGLTEFLPVSSSGHLFLAQNFFALQPNISLEVYLHAASLLAVIIFFWEKIWALITEFCKELQTLIRSPKKSQFTKNQKAILALKLLVATLITFPIALLVKAFVLVNLTLDTVAIALIITGIMIVVAEKFRSTTVKYFTWTTVVLLGIIQGLAVIPGISRSGATIALLILLGLQRKDSAEISFLLSIPTILGALVFIVAEQGFTDLGPEILFASVICFLASIIAIKWMMKLIQSKWVYFVPYCWLLGLGLFFI